MDLFLIPMDQMPKHEQRKTLDQEIPVVIVRNRAAETIRSLRQQDIGREQDRDQQIGDPIQVKAVCDRPKEVDVEQSEQEPQLTDDDILLVEQEELSPIQPPPIRTADP